MQTLAQTNDEKELIPKSFLQSGNDLQITDEIAFKHPLVQDIFDIDKEHLGLYSEDIYYQMINVFLTDPYTYMVFLDDKGIDYESTTPFEVFCLLFVEYMEKLINISKPLEDDSFGILIKNNIYFRAFSFFFGVDSFYIKQEQDGKKTLCYGDGKFLLNDDVYNYVMEFVKRINGIPEGERTNPEDEWAKQILIEDERERLKKHALKHKDDETNTNRLGNLLSTITWTCNGGVTPFNRNQLHIYDLVDGIERTSKLLNYKNTMIGVYSGCIDKKKINLNELHWAK